MSESAIQQARIVVLDNIASEGLQALEAFPGVEFESRVGLAGEELKATLNEFEGAICRSGVTITAECLEGNQRLKAIVRAGVGTDNIDKSAARANDVIVMNTPGGNTLATAELTFALMLGLARNLAPAFASLQNGNWDRKKFQGGQLSGKTLGVVGLGRIGKEVSRRAIAFGMSVLGYDPVLPAESIQELGVQPVESFAEMLGRFDYLTVHTPLTPETKGLVGADEIAQMKEGVRLVNCARGGIYDEAALAEGLKSGKLAGVALDVYETEPCTDSPLFEMPGVLCTPHLGASTFDAQISVAVEAVELLTTYLTTGKAENVVNA